VIFVPEPLSEFDAGAGSGAAVGIVAGANVDVDSEVNVAGEVVDELTGEVGELLLDVVLPVVVDEACILEVVPVGLIQN
jgi:hypothetical protein